MYAFCLDWISLTCDFFLVIECYDLFKYHLCPFSYLYLSGLYVKVNFLILSSLSHKIPFKFLPLYLILSRCVLTSSDSSFFTLIIFRSSLLIVLFIMFFSNYYIFQFLRFSLVLFQFCLLILWVGTKMGFYFKLHTQKVIPTSRQKL